MPALSKRTCDCISCDGGCKRQKVGPSADVKPGEDDDNPVEEEQPEGAREWDNNHDVIDVDDDDEETWAEESAPVLPTKNWLEDLEREDGWLWL